jgi:hypothetical protein
MLIEISTKIRIQEHEGYWYTVEDTHIDAGCDGFTISVWSSENQREDYITMGKEEALAIADAIYKLFKN